MNDQLVLVLPDMHFPYNDPVATECVKKVASVLKPGRIVQLGDILDCAVFSNHGPSHVAEVRVDSFYEQEVVPARQFIATMLDHTELYVQLAGNHEHRVERWALRQGLAGVAVHELVSPQHLLGADTATGQFKWIPYMDTKSPTCFYSITRNLIAVHGWSFAKNAAQIHLDKARSKSVVYGHTHRHQVASTRDPFSGKVLKAFSPGTLSKLQPLYFTGGTPSEWVHGFALVYCSKKGTGFSEYCVTIEKGVCVLPDGKQISL